jgi:hypothetical protein
VRPAEAEATAKATNAECRCQWQCHQRVKTVFARVMVCAFLGFGRLLLLFVVFSCFMFYVWFIRYS